jgi:hypothetical protein
MAIYENSFKKNPNVEQIAPKIFIYRNFISGDLLHDINNLLKDHENAQKVSHNLDWYESRLTKSIPEMHEVWEKASELIYPDLSMHPQLSLLRSSVGEEGMFAHSDAPGQPHDNCGPTCGTCDIASEAIISPDVWNTCCRLHYGLIVYFGDFEGGEVYYPNLNKNAEFIGEYKPLHKNEEFLLKPENGDLIIHGSHGDYSHGTKAVTKGVRFAYSNFVIPSHVNPGTFFNYKTDEYYKQIAWIKEDPKNRWSTWCTPVDGYVWREPKALLEDKKNGIKNIRYRDIKSNGKIYDPLLDHANDTP